MTYISKIAKNGKMQYFRVDADGKKKMVKRGEYEANMPADGQVQMGVEFSESIATVKESTEFASVEIPASEPSEMAYSAEPIPSRPAQDEITIVAATAPQDEVAPFDFVKAAVEAVAGRYKLTYKEWKKYSSVYYRSCAICGFNLDDNGNVMAVKFMGTTLETRKAVTKCEIKTAADWEYIRESVLRQIEFVNEWWNPAEKSA